MKTSEEIKEQLSVEMVALYLHWEKLYKLSIVLGVLLVAALIWQMFDFSIFSVTCWLLTFAVNVYMYFDMNKVNEELDKVTAELITILEKEIENEDNTNRDEKIS